MKPVYVLPILLFGMIAMSVPAGPLMAQAPVSAAEIPEEGADEATADPVGANTEISEEPEGLRWYTGDEIDPDDFLWTARLLVILANTPADPAFEQQVREIRERERDFVLRDVVVVTDTDPAARSLIRQKLRPRGFMLAIIGKDGEVKQRRPAPRSAREIAAVIDSFPMRRQEMLEQRPAGRD